MLHLFRFVLGCAGLLLITSPAWSQNTAGYGDWQLHLPTNGPKRLADAGDRVYVVASNAFYFLDKAQNTTQVLSSRDGLSDVAVADVAYDSVTQQTVVAYKNANIDILRPNGSVRNLSDVLRKIRQGSVQAGADAVKAVSIGGSKAYISTTFGVVVVDLIKLEISDTYSTIGPRGTPVTVYDAASLSGYLYLATSVGLMRGRLTDNLLDYNNWTYYTPAGASGPQVVYAFLAAYGGQVYGAASGGGVANPVVYKFTGNTWTVVNGTYAGQLRRLRSSRGGVLAIDDDYGVRRINSDGTVTTTVIPGAASNTQDAVRSRDGNYYVAYFQKGFQRVSPQRGVAPELYVANGPASQQAFSLLANAKTNTVDVFTGRYTERYDPTGQRNGFYEYSGGQWKNFNSEAFPDTLNFPNLTSPVRGARTPDGTLYVGHYGGGILEWKGPRSFRRFGQGTPGGSPLIGTFFRMANRVEVTDLAATPEGKLWVVNRHLIPNNSGLFILDPAANTWQTIPWVPGLEALERIAVDDNGYAWVSVSRKTDGTSLGGSLIGLYAVDPAATNPNPSRLFGTSSGLPDNQIYELAKDRRGYIWVATIKGVAVFNDPSGPFLSTTGFTLPIVRRGDGTGFPALFSEAVRCMAVDGGDRKWFGTDNGLWLFSPDADEALLHFTTANSPLPSNRIVDVKVNDKTGEVWVATDAGVVAYRGSASVTEGSPSCTAVFPNPVRPDFAGTVGITGLANNAIVKITDVAGHLVYATTASGGTVTWNLTNPNGERVRSGIYLVLSADADGQNGCVSKVAVLSK